MAVKYLTLDGQKNNFFYAKIVLKAQGGDAMKPNGEQLISILVKLLAEQEGVKIKYEIKTGEGDEK